MGSAVENCHLCQSGAGQAGGNDKKGQAYVLDLIYSQEPMEKTELQTAKLFYETNTESALIESNNGSRGFARNVERILWDNFRSRNTKIYWFHQKENKNARIMTSSSYAQNNIFFPSGWDQLYPEFYRDIMGFKRIRKKLMKIIFLRQDN